ncbi:hypothetical protein ACFWTE_05700 [Nocardiopsis sp. NPDC058631]|uniref:hypothetical protein n=1 Tax=Nocardiopsis sp. NPDC058631 TaxID=3346566 RepID=UPI003667783B
MEPHDGEGPAEVTAWLRALDGRLTAPDARARHREAVIDRPRVGDHALRAGGHRFLPARSPGGGDSAPPVVCSGAAVGIRTSG